MPKHTLKYQTDDGQIWLKNAAGKNSNKVWSFTVVGIPSGSTINSVTLSFSVSYTYDKPSGVRVYKGSGTNASNSVFYETSNYSSGSKSVSLNGYITGSGTYALTFYAACSSNADTGNSYVCFDNIQVTIDYSLPYTACIAPTSVTPSSITVDAGASVTLSWSGASAGTNNPITGYHIYRSTSVDGTYEFYIGIGTVETYGSVAVVAPSSPGASYYYKVFTLGTADGYNSSGSTVYSVVMANAYTACSAPTSVSVDIATCAPSGSAILSWSGAGAGTNNPIAGYDIYRSMDNGHTYIWLTTVWTTSTSGSATIIGPSTNGATYHYKVYTLGSAAGYHSSISTAYGILTCSYTAPSAPTDVKLSKCFTTGEDVMLSWTASSGGTNNPVNGYSIYCFDTADNVNFTPGTLYTTLGANVVSCPVPPADAGYYRTYWVIALGTVSGANSSENKTLTRVHSISDVAFTDETLVAGVTRVKAAHMMELQDLANRMKMCYKVTPSASAFDSIVAGETGLGGWSKHVSDIRNAIDNLGVSHAEWIPIANNKPSAAVIQQLRDVLLAV